LLDSSWRRDAGGTSLPFQLPSFGLAEFDGLEGHPLNAISLVDGKDSARRINWLQVMN